MSYLLDTNIFLEILLNQDKKEKAKMFIFDNIERLFISDFSLHSIGVILPEPRQKYQVSSINRCIQTRGSGDSGSLRRSY